MGAQQVGGQVVTRAVAPPAVTAVIPLAAGAVAGGADVQAGGGGGGAAPDYIEQIDRIRPLVARWAGGMATVWTYTVSHGKLVLRLTRPTARGNLHLVCFDCRKICAPTFWGGTNVQIDEEETPEGRRFVLRDAAANVEIRCGHLVAAENVEPIY